MRMLFNELMSGTREYSATGELTTRPPTSLSLKAARTLQNLAGINDTNNLLIQQLQFRERELTTEIAVLRQEISDLLAQQKSILIKEENGYIRDGGKEASTVDPRIDGQSDLFGRDSGSEANNANQNSSN